MELQLIEEQPYNRENRENREVTLVIPATNGTGDIKSFLNTVREAPGQDYQNNGFCQRDYGYAGIRKILLPIEYPG